MLLLVYYIISYHWAGAYNADAGEELGAALALDHLAVHRHRRGALRRRLRRLQPTKRVIP